MQTSLLTNFMSRAKYKQVGKTDNNPMSTQTRMELECPKMIRIARVFNITMIIAYIYVILKYCLINTLHLTVMKPYRYLDCYLPGRMIFDGRTTRASRTVGPAIWLFFLSNRSFILYFKPKFSFHLFEFLLKEYDEVEASEFESSRRKIQPQREATGNLGLFDMNLMLHYNQTPSFTTKTQTDLYGYDGFSRKYDPFSNQRDFVIRSAKIWLIFVVSSCLYSIGELLYLISFVTCWLFVNTSHVFGRLGFELNYANCIDYIIEYRQTNNNSNHYDSIYVPNENASYPSGPDPKVPRILPWENITTGPYHSVRIFAEFIENQFLIYDLVATISAHFHLVFFMILELYLNYKLMRKNLKILVLKLRRSRLFRDTCYESDHLGEKTDMLGSLQSINWQSMDFKNETAEATEVQVNIVNHFKLMSKYNHYMSFYCTYIISFWLIHTGMFCIWIGLSGSQSIQTEFYLLEWVTTVFVVIVLSVVASIRYNNLKLYPLIGSAMALEQNSAVTKKNWMTILMHFQPRPMYCFWIFGSMEISNLFILKVS